MFLFNKRQGSGDKEHTDVECRLHWLFHWHVFELFVRLRAKFEVLGAATRALFTIVANVFANGSYPKIVPMELR